MSTADTHFDFPDPVSHPEFYADVTSYRLASLIIDSLLITLITVALTPLTAFSELLFFGSLGVIVSLIYRSVSLSSRSATPGMLMMDIEFRTLPGERLSPGLAIAHAVLFTLWVWLLFPLVISLILMLTTARGRSLNDFVLGTAVVKKASPN